VIANQQEDVPDPDPVPVGEPDRFANAGAVEHRTRPAVEIAEHETVNVTENPGVVPRH
jgi:hypothetical protein